MREDIPQALRGQRNVVFGNIEKIYEFHNQYFLTELEHCENNPFIVGQCFLDFVCIVFINVNVMFIFNLNVYANVMCNNNFKKTSL